LLIQITRRSKRDVKVELLLRIFASCTDSGKAPELSRSLCFVRERIHLDAQDIVISQFFGLYAGPEHGVDGRSL